MSCRACAVIAVLLLLACADRASAAVSLPPAFSDHGVLQRDMPLPIWGRAAPGKAITVTLAERSATTKADADGSWRVELAALPAGGPHVLVVVAGAERITVNDLVIGEVWIAAGQSNMMMGLAAAAGGQEALARAATYPTLRMSQPTGPILRDQPAAEVGMAWGAPHQGSSAVGFFFAEELHQHFAGKVPIGILAFTEIRPGECWCDPAVLRADPSVAWLVGAAWAFAGQLYNGVIEPISPYAIRGAIYYQGEMNSGSTHYAATMRALVGSWRKAWGRDDLPFLFVQLPGFQEHRAAADKRLDMDAAALARVHSDGSGHGFCTVRECQLEAARTIPDTGMAVTIDIGEAWDIHPQEKRIVGKRLALQARKVAYGERVVASGPLATAVAWKGAQAVVTFAEVGGGLIARDGAPLGFELAGEDQVFHAADARIQGKTVVVTCKAVPQPHLLHYAWAGFPRATLFNQEGLPASPFRVYDHDHLHLASLAEVATVDPDFAAEGTPAWSLANGAVAQKSADGTALLMPNGANAIQSFGIGGYMLNASPVRSPTLIRPGCIVGVGFDLAAEPGPGTAQLYARLACQDGGFQSWDDPNVTTTAETFSRRQVAWVIDNPNLGVMNAFVMFGNVAATRPFRLRRVSPLTIVRPELAMNGPQVIDLGALARAATAESAPITIANGQTVTVPRDIAGAGPQAVPTILHGLADVAPSAAKRMQTVAQPIAEVGAVLIGADAASFALVGEHVTGDTHGVTFFGGDGQPGLAGGPTPDRETVTVRFLGSDKPRTYRATLRIVTQACNRGRLSRGEEGEPPVNLHYVDVQVSATVR